MRDLVRGRGLGLCLADLLAHRIEVVEVTEVGHTAQQLHRLFLMRLYLLGLGIQPQTEESAYAQQHYEQRQNRHHPRPDAVPSAWNTCCVTCPMNSHANSQN